MLVALAVLSLLTGYARAEAAAPLERQIGQVLMVTARPKDLPALKPWIERGRLGGVLLRVGSLKVEEVRRLTMELQDWARPSGSPLLLAVDNEGGPQFTLRSMGLTVFPSHMALGATYSDMYAFLSSYYGARELKSLGIHMNFAPVLDVNTNPKNPIIGLRSFGDDPLKVSAQGVVAVEGMRRGRVAAVAKHFPGHGDTLRDSHADLPTVPHDRAHLERVELAPFKAAVDAGVPAVMTAHVAFPALDPSGIPATLSAPILTGLLRREWGFDGVIVTDSLDMRAITGGWPVPEAGVAALNAGADLLLLGGDLDTYQAAFDAIVAALGTRKLPLGRLREAAGRVEALKAEYVDGEPPEPLSEAERKRIRLAADEIAERSVTVLEDERGLLPLETARPLVVVFAPPGYQKELGRLEEDLRARFPGVRMERLLPEPKPAELKRLRAAAADADLLVVGTFHWSRSRYDGQVRAVEGLLASGKPSVLVSLMNPFDQAHFRTPHAARVATYGLTEASMAALAKVLLGTAAARGLPPARIQAPAAELADPTLRARPRP